MRDPKLYKNEQVIQVLDVYYCGWECDNTAWVIENVETGKRHCIGTDHGREYKMSIAELGELLSEYQKVAKETKKAIHLLQGNGNES